MFIFENITLLNFICGLECQLIKMSIKPWFRRCDIKYCTNATCQNATVHSAPRTPELFKKWEEAVKCTGTRLPRNGKVCEKHFDSGDIVEFGCLKKEREGSSGSELVVTENIKMRVLVHGAVPSKFEDEIAEYLKHKELHNEELNSVLGTTPEKKLVKKRPFRDFQLLKQKDNNNVTARVHNIQNAVKLLKSAEELLFEKVYVGQIEPRLPNKSWNVHNCQLPEKGIVFAELAELTLDHSVPPFLKKSVFFDGSFNMRVYFFGKFFPSVEFKRPTNIRDLEELLRHVNAFKICEGGPPLSQVPISKLAKKDEHIYKWRHANCEIRLKKGRICKLCSILCKSIEVCKSDNSNSKTTLNPTKKFKK